MDYLVPLGCAALLVGFVLYVGLPLYASRQQVQSPSFGAPARSLQERKEQLYATIKELEFDRSLGKLAEEDYQHQRQELEAQALALLQKLDQLNGHTHIEALQARIEEDILTLRGASSRGLRCPSCRAQYHPGDRFCSQCGTRFEEVE